MENNYKKNILNKLKRKKSKIVIVGLGYVGQPLFNLFKSKNFKVYGIDNDKKKVKDLKFKLGKNNIFYDYKIIKKADIIIFCLPTPLKKNKPDLSHVKDSFKKMFKFLKHGQMIIMESTTYPGSTNEIFVKKLGFKFNIGKDYFLGYSPERISPEVKNKAIKSSFKFDLFNTPKICSGYTKNCSEIIFQVYSSIIKRAIKAKSIETAEMCKLVENIYRAVNISMVNELKMISEKLKLNIYDVLDLADTKPFGFTKFKPGPGIGGHCIPIDPYYLYWAANKKKYKPKFIKLAGDTNKTIIKWTTKKILKVIKQQKISKEKVLICGVSYKKEINDIRESPAVKISKKLIQKKIKFNFFDPYVEKLKINKKCYKSIKFDKKTLSKFKVAIIFTDHEKIVRNIKKVFSGLVIDTRGSIKNYGKLITI